MLLPNFVLRGAIVVAEAIRKRTASQKPMGVADPTHTVTVGCGVHALVPGGGMAAVELIAAADNARSLAMPSEPNHVSEDVA